MRGVMIVQCHRAAGTFFFECSGALRALLSFPTRRSSDLHRLAGDVEDADVFLFDGGVGLTGVDAHDHLIAVNADRSEEHTSELQSHSDLVCRLLLEKKKERQRSLTSTWTRTTDTSGETTA